MAKPIRRTERIEPVLDRSDSAEDTFDIRLGDKDRTVGSAAPKPDTRVGDDVEDAEFIDIEEGEAAVSRRSARDSKRGNGRGRKGRTAKRGARRGGGGGSGIGRIIGRTIRFLFIFAIVSTVALAGGIAYYAARLPSTADWSVPKRPPNIKILANDGSLIANRGDTGGESVRLDELPPYLPEAVVAIEDRRFYHHFGIDPIGLIRAAYVNFRSGSVVQGGSTLTQQLAKNLFLKPERTFDRKIQEAIMALWLEAKYSKPQILEAYLNRVYLGAGAYGVDAAARRYFGKSARNVSLKEAAILAALLKAPSRYAPTVDPDAANERADVVLAAMQQEGFISAADAKKASSITVQAKDDGEGGAGRYVADWVADLVPDVVGALDKDVIVETTIDPHLEDAAGRAVSQGLDKDGKTYGVSQGALVAIDGTGAVRALVGGRDYQKSQYNRAVESKRQPGSAFKPFVYLTALEFGMTPETVRVDEPIKIGTWEPKNYEKGYKGPVTLQTALALSINTVAAQLANEVGPDRVINTAKLLGINSPLQPNPSIALGTSEVSLLELTDAYVPFANGGYGVPPHVVTTVKSVDGDVLYQHPDVHATQIVDPTYVGMMNSMMQDTLLRGTGRKAAIPGWQAAGKTGTSQDSRDGWFMGYTANLTAGVWLGNDDSSPTKKMTGGTLPATIWTRFMTEAHKGVVVAALPGDYTFRDPNRVDPNAQVSQADQTIGQGAQGQGAQGQGVQDPNGQDPNGPYPGRQASGQPYPSRQDSPRQDDGGFFGEREVPPPPGVDQDGPSTGSTRRAADPAGEGAYDAGDPELANGAYDAPPRRNRYASDPYADDGNGPVPPASVGSAEDPPPRYYEPRTHHRNFLQRLFGG